MRAAQQRVAGLLAWGRVPALAALFVSLVPLVCFGSAQASSGPTIESESVSNVTEHDATLEARIGTDNLYTGYWFQIDTNSSYDFTQPVCPFELPGYASCESIIDGQSLPAGLVEPEPQYVPAGSGSLSVSVDLASIGATLEPATTYHYRVIASNGAPTVNGPDQTFTTLTHREVGGQAGPFPPPPAPVGSVVSLPAPSSGVLGTQTETTVVPTRAQKLAKALKICRAKKLPKDRRVACVRQAERRYKAAGRQARGRT